MRRFLTALISCIFLISVPPIFSDNIRGEVVRNIVLDDSSVKLENTFTMNIEDVFSVSINDTSDFIRGYEIEVGLTSGLRRYGSSFALNIYTDITSEVSEGVGTYQGSKYDTIILPEAARFFIRIPYQSTLDTDNGPYTTVFNEITDTSDFPMMFTILPMMKGFPSSLYDNKFNISITPVFKDAGILDLDITIPQDLNNNQLEVFIDNKSAGIADSYKLSSGSHSLEIRIPGGMSINRDFMVNSGETTNISVELEKLESSIIINVPENTIVYIDGEKLESIDNKIQMEPGEHLILFKIGDYKISKKFDILPGKDCKISLFLDIFIEDN